MCIRRLTCFNLQIWSTTHLADWSVYISECWFETYKVRTGLSGCAVSVLSFGFAGSLPTMIAARCVAGLLSEDLLFLDHMLVAHILYRWQCRRPEVGHWRNHRRNK